MLITIGKQAVLHFAAVIRFILIYWRTVQVSIGGKVGFFSRISRLWLMNGSRTCMAITD